MRKYEIRHTTTVLTCKGGSFIFWGGSHISACSGGMAMGLFKCNQAHVVGIIRPLDWDRVNVSDNLGATPVSPVVTPLHMYEWWQ